MNSSYGKPNNKTGSVNSFDFDLGLGSGRSRSMKDQSNQTSSHSSTTYAYSAAQQRPNATSWTHQPAYSAPSGLPGSTSGPTSMVGDIFGKTWNSPAPPSSGATGVGVVNNKNPNLFGDLVNSAMGANKSSSNVPLKKSAPVSSQNTFSMGSVANSLPKTSYSVGGASVSNVGGSGGNVNFGGNFNKSSGLGGSNVNLVGNIIRNPNLGGPSMKSAGGSGAGGVGMGTSKDPFVSLVDFGSKQPAGMTAASKASDKSGFGDDLFGGFQNATTNSSGASPTTSDDSFGNFQNASSKTSGNSFSSGPFSTNNKDPMGDPFGSFPNASSKTSGSSSSFSSGAFTTSNNDPLGDFGFPSNITNNQSQPPKHSSGANDFDSLFSSNNGGDTGGVESFANQKFSEGDDWGINSDFGVNDAAGGTTELEGLPPPPAGVSASAAKNKGVDNYKQGQFADAIKWLSWAVLLLEKAGDDDGTTEVLTSRASCYKEVGEYKKAVADCTKVLDRDGKNVSVLVQRALLYESMEKYKLGAEDLRTVMNIDPGNRVARSTIHRLTKMAG